MISIDTPISSESISKSEATMLRYFRASNAEVQQFLIAMAEGMSRQFPAYPKTQLRLVSNGPKQGTSKRKAPKARATQSNIKGVAHLRLLHE